MTRMIGRRGVWAPAAAPGAAVVVALAMALVPALPPLAAAPPGEARPAATIVDEWGAARIPPPPALKPVTVDPAAAAFLIMDILRQTCNMQRRPRCVASVPRIAALLARATDRQMLVVYSILPGTRVDDVLPEVRPFPGQPLVTAYTDKFLGTDLETMLKGRGIKTLIVAGTAAHGAVMTTSAEAALRGFQVAVPVDLMSADSLYPEQYVAWHLANSPVIPANITLTRSDLIRF